MENHTNNLLYYTIEAKKRGKKKVKGKREATKHALS